MQNIQQSQYISDPFFLKLKEEINIISFGSNLRPEKGSTPLKKARTKDDAYKLLNQNQLIYFIDDLINLRIYIRFKVGEVKFDDNSMYTIDGKYKDTIHRNRHIDAASTGDKNDKYIIINYSDFEKVKSIGASFNK